MRESTFLIRTATTISDEIRTNQDVKQDYHTILFNIYVNVLIRRWKHRVNLGVELGVYTNTLLFTDYQLIIQ